MIVASPLTPLEHLLRHVLDWLHGTVGLPWAWSIVALTVLVRIVLVPLTVRQIHSMQSLQRHAPQMKEIQRKYKGDKQKLNEELMKFYRENKINPAASCLPILFQIPVFIALYFVLRTFSRHPPGGIAALERGDFDWLNLFHITVHASKGWGPLLLVIYAGSQTLSTWLMSSTMDKTQRTILLIMPIVFIFIVANFPQGLVIYWVTTNLWTVGQGIVTRTLVPKTPVTPKKTSRTPPKGDEGGDGAKRRPEQPKPPPAAAAAPPQARRVKRKKKKKARR